MQDFVGFVKEGEGGGAAMVQPSGKETPKAQPSKRNLIVRAALIIPSLSTPENAAKEDLRT